MSDRSVHVAAQLAERELDLLLITNPFNVRYVTGFTGSNGIAVVGAGADGQRRFLTDFRYAVQSAEQIDPGYSREIVAVDLLDAFARSLAAAVDAAELARGTRLGFDDAHLTVKQHASLVEHLAGRVELLAAGGVVEALRLVKDADEVARIRAAAELVDDVYAWMIERGLVGRTEREVAIELERELRLRGAQAPSFPSIVAAGAHGALPHAEPRDVEIPADTFVIVDIGALLDGYCSDCTRTFATGELDDDARAVYELVLRAQQTGLAAVAPGPTGREVDAVARAVIDAAGHGEHFGHGLGHGVGLEVHEGPRLARTASDVRLRRGHVVTVEPGVYLPGRFGVRIEDLVVVTDTGHEPLSGFPTALTSVG